MKPGASTAAAGEGSSERAVDGHLMIKEFIGNILLERANEQANSTDGQSSIIKHPVAKEWGEWHPSRFDEQKRLRPTPSQQDKNQQARSLQLKNLEFFEKMEKMKNDKKRIEEATSEIRIECSEIREFIMEDEQEQILEARGFNPEPDCDHPNFPVTIVKKGNQFCSITSVEEFNEHLARTGDKARDEESEPNDNEVGEENEVEDEESEASEDEDEGERRDIPENRDLYDFVRFFARHIYALNIQREL